MEIRFRPAAPEDVAAAVPLIHSAGPEAFEFCFASGDRSARDFLDEVFVDGRGLFGWRNHTVALADGEVAGIGAFYSGSDYGRLSNELLRQVLRFYPLWRLPSVLRRMLQLSSVMPPPSRSTLYVADLGVRADLRSHGIGAALLHNQQELARQRGFRSYALDVSVQNPRGQALYERLGFRVIREQHFKGAAGAVPDTRRMVLSLGG